ncbi:YggT family protein [Helicobacter pylori]|uniref:YggT family protein n=1 Tax=Helicobacter pylori TaxID=210 RepID=UPI00165BDEE3|nr:YggT family protein [Helicobacter pylori]MBH0233452.1 YggT family protein [Helicobacter pylori]MBH0248740.1 YggT family protein [Helicobacter pylori]
MIFSTLLNAIAVILSTLLTICMWIVIIYSLLGFVQPNPNNPIMQILARLCEPVFYFLRSRFKLVFNGLDFAPLVVVIVLKFLDLTLIQWLFMLAKNL